LRGGEIGTSLGCATQKECPEERRADADDADDANLAA